MSLYLQPKEQAADEATSRAVVIEVLLEKNDVLDISETNEIDRTYLYSTHYFFEVRQLSIHWCWEPSAQFLGAGPSSND